MNMNQKKIGEMLKTLRREKNLTQAELAEKLCVSDKTISKWETAKGYPDISLLEPLAKSLDVSITELISGNAVNNVNVSANMLRSKFYVCPVCGNIMHCMGEAVVQCHGVQLMPCQPEEADERHRLSIERVEDEYFVHIAHDMTKEHYISFVAYVACDRMQFVKFYPEGNAETRLQLRGRGYLYYYCNQHGLCRKKRV